MSHDLRNKTIEWLAKSAGELQRQLKAFKKDNQILRDENKRLRACLEAKENLLSIALDKSEASRRSMPATVQDSTGTTAGTVGLKPSMSAKGNSPRNQII